MKDWRNVSVNIGCTIREALACIDQGAVGGAIVVDVQDKLQGFVTDGDVRRGLLKGYELKDSITNVMNPSPITAKAGEDNKKIFHLMKAKRIGHIPVIDHRNCVIGIESLKEHLQSDRVDNPVIIMAGGKGQRLRPYTETCPKPLLTVGDKPVLETILERFCHHGFHRFIFSINYRGDMIKDHFKDGDEWGVSIEYLEEDQPLGTAGSLSLLNPKPTMPFIVMNGDIMTDLNFHHLLQYHISQSVTATICVREYQQSIPYGVVQVDENRMLALEEKPVHSYFVNAGIYVLDPSVLSLVQTNMHSDMPDLLKKLIDNKAHTTVFPLTDYWIDIGKIEDFERAHQDYSALFETS